MEHCPSDLYVLCQLTQPLRERGLLKRVIEQYKKNRKTIISATKVRDTRWRLVDKQGRWNTKTDDKVLLHDGVIYAWSDGHLGDIYDKDCPHDVIVSSDRIPLVDVDYQEDLPDWLPNHHY